MFGQALTLQSSYNHDVMSWLASNVCLMRLGRIRKEGGHEELREASGHMREPASVDQASRASAPSFERSYVNIEFELSWNAALCQASAACRRADAVAKPAGH